MNELRRSLTWAACRRADGRRWSRVPEADHTNAQLIRWHAEGFAYAGDPVGGMPKKQAPRSWSTAENSAAMLAIPASTNQ